MSLGEGFGGQGASWAALFPKDQPIIDQKKWVSKCKVFIMPFPLIKDLLSTAKTNTGLAEMSLIKPLEGALQQGAVLNANKKIDPLGVGRGMDMFASKG
jgi:hypothetical protein